MPISKANAKRYPKDWKAISARIRFDRADSRCECDGMCGLDHGGRCEARHGKPHPRTGSRVTLTTAHLSEQVEDCSDENLRAMCEQCHNRYDQPMRQRNAAATRSANRQRILDKAGQLGFEVACFGPIPPVAAQK